jgi:8-oxo-dGTP diphosphatase
MVVDVAVAIIQNQNGEILLALRNQKDYLSSMWELPGGKIELGESEADTLKRELKEELGIDAEIGAKIITTEFVYPKIHVRLHAFAVTNHSGKIKAQEGQTLEWFRPEDINESLILKASIPIINAIILPDKHLITPTNLSEKNLINHIDKALQNSPEILIQYRDPSRDNYIETAGKLTKHVRNLGGKIMLNSDTETAIKLGADGVHLNSTRLKNLIKKPAGLWVSASCHNLAEIQIANRLKLDFIVLSPVCKTSSHPEAKPLGWDRFESLVEVANMPVYALGGMNIQDIEKSKQLGGQGVAGISLFK